MNETWKGFWRGFWTILGIILAGIVSFLFLRGRGKGNNASVGTPAAIEEDAQRKIEATREEIKKDSDEELKNRFNALAKGKEKKG